MSYKDIPQELKDLKQWVCYRDKAPLSPLYNGNASPTNPDHWGTFEQAVRAIEKYNYKGIGFVFTDTTPYCGIDIDHCINTDTGEINHNALDIIQTMDTYTELSPSGTGLHIIYKGKNHPTDWKKKKTDALGKGVDLEMYQEQRYFRVTGNQYGDYSAVCEAESMAELVYNTYFSKTEDKPVVTPTPDIQPLSDCGNSQSLSDDRIIELASKNNRSFSSLYSGNTANYSNDDSKADAALCSILAFYTKDTTQIDRIFRKSGLMRDKWDRPTAGSTYGKITIDYALSKNTASYDADYYSKNTPVADLIKPETVGSNEPFRIEIPKFSFEDIKYWEQNAISTAEHFANCIKDYVCYVPELKGFMIWNGCVWVEDIDGCAVMGCVKQFVKNCYDCIPSKKSTVSVAKERLSEQGRTKEEIESLPLNKITEEAKLTKEEQEEIENENQALDYIAKYYKQQLSLKARKSIIEDTHDLLNVSYKNFDNKPLIFNVLNGTLDLSTMTLYDHRKEDYLTVVANVIYDPTATAPIWTNFIDTVFCGNQKDALFMQKALGYNLSGKKNAECCFLCYGPTTRNGKGTLFNTILDVFGGYGKQMEFSTIARAKNQKDGSSPSPDIIRLKGARLVSASEPKKGVYFDESLLKQLTGRDPITARSLYKEPIQFFPEFSIFISANNKPGVSDPSLFQSDRLKQIDFNRHFSEEEQDKNLKDKLIEPSVKSAVLNWLIEGYILYNREGLIPTENMKASLKEYQDDSDIIQQYINERLEEATHEHMNECMKGTKVRNDYIEWCKYMGVTPMGRATFKEEMKKHGVSYCISHHQDVIFNYNLKSEFAFDVCT
ncbi:MAG: phage/plasmid primase, P4 family [Acutalibacteraceae bacterium]